MTQTPTPKPQGSDLIAELPRLREIAEKATPGPWFQSCAPWFSTGSVVLAGSPDPHVGLCVTDTETWEGQRAEDQENNPALPLADADDDAAFIATFDPPTVISLIDQTLSLKAEVERLRGALEPFVERLADTFPDDADNSGITVKVKHLRAARAALSQSTGDDQIIERAHAAVPSGDTK